MSTSRALDTKSWQSDAHEIQKKAAYLGIHHLKHRSRHVHQQLGNSVNWHHTDNHKPTQHSSLASTARAG